MVQNATTFGRSAGAVILRAAVETPQTAEALRRLLAEQARLKQEPVPAEELAAERYFARDAMRIVVVGDASRIVPELGKLGLGEIEVRARR